MISSTGDPIKAVSPRPESSRGALPLEDSGRGETGREPGCGSPADDCNLPWFTGLHVDPIVVRRIEIDVPLAGRQVHLIMTGSIGGCRLADVLAARIDKHDLGAGPRC